jgi:ABC-type uncharacterized transport system substrate-binding protein
MRKTRFEVFAQAGGLMSYSANYAELWREMAVYVAKILKGAKGSSRNKRVIWRMSVW